MTSAVSVHRVALRNLEDESKRDAAFHKPSTIIAIATNASGSNPRHAERANSTDANAATIALSTVPSAMFSGLWNLLTMKDSCIY